MGVIDKVEEAAQPEGPSCPSIFIGTFEIYRELKFVKKETAGSVKLYPRDMLTWQDIIAYKNATMQHMSIIECEVIMGLDGVFEGKEDG